MTSATVGVDRRTSPSEPAVLTTRWRTWGCEVALVTRGADPRRHDRAVARMRRELDAVDRAISRFRADSELTAVNARPDVPHPVSALFLDLLADALDAARRTGGLVVPTLGRPLVRLGYDRDLALLPVRVTDGATGTPAARALPAERPPAESWRRIVLDRTGPDGSGTVRVPAGVALDLGSIGKAASADRIAALLAADELAGTGGLVNLGGDLAVLPGPETGAPWEIAIDESGRDDPRPPRTAVRIGTGGLATSSTAVRVWSSRGVGRHHVLDPRTGLPAQPVWRCVSVHAGDCRTANAASTAAVVLGETAPAWLAAHGFAARLVPARAGDHRPVLVGGWPADVAPLPTEIETGTTTGTATDPERTSS
ncbi:thiamine biosynthesis lipoprotein [Friedmanniella endophytica]|uniref:FAD:protein FMN transferase n=1 Tax=Microlunatus kandeliicorticis TaxID=1759536 RepID=A0A7W3P7I8_9ACTN|nr:FAD:protein FMN transferase [Microlunatus kandeliicorticis]MBA8796078.1 thiamine biosynthesis lipoprotein [Microlunatus kandeliicorticis]